MPFVGKPRPPASTPAERAVDESRFVASLYVNRKKVWEGRASSEEEAARLAREEKSKHKGVKTTTTITESPR